MKKEEKIKLIVDNSEEKIIEKSSSFSAMKCSTNPIYEKYLNFVDKKNKHNNIFKVFFDELF